MAPLGATQRDRLVTAMAEVERLIRAAAVEVRMEAPNSVDARWCLDEYFRELAERTPGLGVAHSVEHISPAMNI